MSALLWANRIVWLCRRLLGRPVSESWFYVIYALLSTLIATSLKQHLLGLEEIDDGVWSIYFCHVLLARIDERDYVLRA